MQLSKLIETLEKYQEKYGELEVSVDGKHDELRISYERREIITSDGDVVGGGYLNINNCPLITYDRFYELMRAFFGKKAYGNRMDSYLNGRIGK